jgi:peptide/nickel transport system substrate-binding protein
VVVAWKEHPTRKPKLDKIIIKAIPEPAQRVNGLRSGVVDFSQSLPLDQVANFRRDGFGIEVRTAGYSGSWGMDMFQDSPMRDKRVRLAVNLAIDKDVVSKSVYEGLAPVEKGQVTQPEAFGFNPNLQPYAFDPAQARRLLAEAGYPNGFSITADVWMASSEIQKLALLIQQQLKDIGITMEIAGYSDVATFLDKGRGIKPRAPIYNGGPAIIPTMDAEPGMTAYLGTQPQLTRRMQAPEFDRLMGLATQELDTARREKLLQDAAAILRDEMPVIFLVQQTGANVWTGKVRGIIPRIPDDMLMETIEKVA